MDPQAADVLQEMDLEAQVKGSNEDIESQRDAVRAAVAQISDERLHQFDGKISDTTVRSGNDFVSVRRYEPRDVIAGAAIVYFHGGGWVFGDLDTGDRFARSLARALRVTVLSTHYRRAPEDPYPAALEDCIAVAESAREEFKTWCAVAGDSAGGNLAIATCLAASRSFDAQLLLYPALDASMEQASYETYAEGFGLTRDVMKYYWDAYAGEHPRTDPHLSPLSAKSVSGLPPTVLATAGFDVLSDEGQRLAERLASSDVGLTYLPFLSLPHGFIDLVDRVDAAREAVAQILDALRVFVALNPPTSG